MICHNIFEIHTKFSHRHISKLMLNVCHILSIALSVLAITLIVVSGWYINHGIQCPSVTCGNWKNSDNTPHLPFLYLKATQTEIWFIEAGRCIYALVSYAVISSDNGSSPFRHQAIIYTNAELMLIGLMETSFNRNTALFIQEKDDLIMTSVKFASSSLNESEYPRVCSQ